MTPDYIILISLAAVPLGYIIVCALFAYIRSGQISRSEEKAEYAAMLRRIEKRWK